MTARQEKKGGSGTNAQGAGAAAASAAAAAALPRHKEDSIAEKKQEIEKRLEAVAGQLSSGAPPNNATNNNAPASSTNTNSPSKKTPKKGKILRMFTYSN